MLRPGQIIALCVLTLLTIGVVMVNSAGMSVDPAARVVSLKTVLLSKSTVYMGMALLALGIGAFLPIRRLAQALARPDPLAGTPGQGPASGLGLLVITVLLLLLVLATVYVPGLGKEINGSHRWLRVKIPGMSESQSFQPSEVAKWVLVGLVAWYGARRAIVMGEFWRGLVPALCAIGLVAGVVVLEDLGTGVLIGASCCLVLIAAGARLWQFLMFVPLGLAGLFLAIWKSPYRLGRITSFLEPYSDPKGRGYHMIQSMAAVAGGEGPGRGLGHGQQKFDYLPEDQTDFLFAIICEELGIAGAAVVIGLFAALVVVGLLIVRREKELALKLLGLGILTTVGLQAVINLVVVTGLGPTKGIALPLVSSGGTGWILTAFSLGLLVAIDRTQTRVAPQESAGVLPAPISG